MKRWAWLALTAAGSVAILAVGAIALLALTQPSDALTCQTVNDQEICILSVKRSAKNYWEYRASVSIDGLACPVEIYNCRDRRHILKDGTAQLFQPDGAGALICSLLN